MSIESVIEYTLYFLALVNPVAKVLFLTAEKPPYTANQLISISFKSNVVALLILVILASFGNFLLLAIFHIEIYSLSVAGGVILFTIGLNAVREGSFLEANKEVHRVTDISVVPLATPLIAGPGAMTAAISLASVQGRTLTIVCVTIAIIINFIVMLFSHRISHTLEKFKAVGPTTRIIGLIVTAVAMQMIFNGCSAWFKGVF